MNLRYNQSECVVALMTNITGGRPDNLCVEPTGSGKSAIMGATAKEVFKIAPGKKVLYISHRKELDTQNAEAFAMFNPEMKFGFEKANQKCDPAADAMFASILTVGKTGLKRIRQWCDPKEIAAVFIDEAHHIPGGKTYQTLLRELRAENPNIPVIGLTATPERADDGRLGDYLAHLAHETELTELIEAGFLATLKGVSVKTESSLEDIHSSAGDFVDSCSP